MWVSRRLYKRIRCSRIALILIVLALLIMAPAYVLCGYTYIISPIKIALQSRSQPRRHSKSVPRKDCVNVTILTPLRNRKHYVQLLAAGWSWLQIWRYARVHMFLDESTEYTVSDLRNWFPYATTHAVDYKHPDVATRAALQFYVDNPPLESTPKCTEIAMFVDSDALLHPNWMEFIEHNFVHTDGVMSLYHSDAKWHKTFNCTAALCRMGSTGAFGMMMSRTMAERVLCHSHGGTKVYKKDFDWEVIYYLQSQNVSMYVPNRSMILHYGMHGTHGRGKHFDTTVGFEMVGYPDAIQEAASHFLAGNKKLKPKMLEAVASIYMQQQQANRSTYAD